MLMPSEKRYLIFPDNSVLDKLTGDALPFRLKGNGSYKTKKRAIKRRLKEMSTGFAIPFEFNEDIKLGHLKANTVDLRDVYPSQTSVCLECGGPQRSANMCNEMKVQEITADDKAREHLRDRLFEVFRQKNRELEEKFGLSYEMPKTRKELAEALKAGKYTIKGLDKDPDEGFDCWESPTHYIRWTLIPEDKKGYDAAYKRLDAARAATKDMIIVSSPADGLKAFRDFEAMTFS